MVPAHDLVSWVFENDVREDQTVLLDTQKPEERCFSKGQVRSYVRQLAFGLQKKNGGPLFGNAVCVHAFNDALYPVLFLGIVGSGAAFTGTNPAYKKDELAHHFKISKTLFVITEQAHLTTVLEACKVSGIPESSVFLLEDCEVDPKSDLRPWTDLLSHGEGDWTRLRDEHESKTTTAALFSTSGTSGLPKMAVRTHYNLISEGISVVDNLVAPYKQMRLIAAPLFHAFASPLGNLAPIRTGVPTFIMRRFAMDTFLDAVLEHEITETTALPPIIINFLALSPEQKYKLKSLQTVWCGGAPLDIHTQRKALSLFGTKARIAQVWGMTETGWITTFFYPDNDDTGSVGQTIPGFSTRILDESGSILNESTACGEICVKGPAIMQGYLNNPNATRDTIDADGWLHTGDIGCFRNSKVYVVDRKKDLIKVRGWQVSPAELEGSLLQHPAIVDAAVLGVMHPGAVSEVPRAFVVRKKGSGVNEASVKSFLLSKLARYKVMDCEITFLDEIPKSPSGKILRRVLRAGVSEGGQLTSISIREKVWRRFREANSWIHRGLVVAGCVAGAMLLSIWHRHIGIAY